MREMIKYTTNDCHIKGQEPLILGFDIGGTKTLAVIGTVSGEVLDQISIITPIGASFKEAFSIMVSIADDLIKRTGEAGYFAPSVISVSIGGPLDIEKGIIYSPPHLGNWVGAPLKETLERHFRLPVFIEHDGNAGALAEAYFGAAKGFENVIYLTMGTGLGAGLILNGEIYRGTTDASGEVGHIRIADQGPFEYGKAGSWEGFCSGAGMVKLAKMRYPHLFPEGTTTQQLVIKALSGNQDACKLIEEVGEWLGKGIALLIDILNPQIVIVGTLGVVLGDLLLEPARGVVRNDALHISSQACKIVPAQLSDSLGSVSALIAAVDAYHKGYWIPRSENSYQNDYNLIADSLKDGIKVRRFTLDLLLPKVVNTGQRIVRVLMTGGKIMVFGNGGSAATAHHLVGELIGRYKAERNPLPAIALTADSSVITCIANDYAYDQIFARQVEALAKNGDLVIGITTSGRSESVINGLNAAKKAGCITIALTGERGLLGLDVDYLLCIPSASTARIQEEHDAIIHAWCEVIDQKFSKSYENNNEA
jgi:predicted NBD/HSP70 family sugar kinase/phosphoheptose isomerase